MKFLDEFSIDLEVFAQELLREHLAISSLRISLSCFLKSDTHIYRPIVPFQNGLKKCVFSKSFFWNSSLVIDYTVIFWRVMSFQSVVASNQLQTSSNWLHDSKFKFKTFFKSCFSKLSFGNRCSGIDYQSLDILETLVLRQKLDLELILKQCLFVEATLY